MTHANLSARRHCLQWLGIHAAALGALGHAPSGLAAAAPVPNALARKRLIMFMLYGGNDGLNTCVPFRDPLYRRLRPTLGLASSTLLPLDDDIALHPALREFMAMYQAGEVAIVQDVGYPKPSLSHFESAAVWESANPMRLTRSTGWFGDTVMSNRAAFDAARFDAAAISFDRSNGFAAGVKVPVYLALQNMAATLGNPARLASASVPEGAPAAASRLADIVNEGHAVGERLAARLKNAPAPQWHHQDDMLTVRIKLADWFIANDVAAPVIRLGQDGFDTHSGQLERQSVLLGSFDAALARLRTGLKATGAWDDTVVMVSTEFGRRAAENGFGGTDHGTSGPVFLVGGKVRGGLYGRRAPLDDLDIEGNLKFSTDLRRIYATVVERLWALPANPFAQAGHAALDVALA